RHEPLVDIDQPVLEVPAVTPRPVGVFLHRVLGAGVELEVAPALPLDPGALLPELLREPRLPDVGRLDDVVVDADDLRQVHARDPTRLAAALERHSRACPRAGVAR